MLRQLALGAALLVTGMVGSSMAATVVTTGGPVLSVVNVSENAASTLGPSAADTLFSLIPNAFRIVTVPGGIDDEGNPVIQTRLFTATFSAESDCFGNNAAARGWCSVRIVATRNGNICTNVANANCVIFNPNAGVGGVGIRDFAFDANRGLGQNDFNWEGNSTTQSARLPSGTWIIRAQQALEIFVNQTGFRLDDYNLQIVTSQ